MVQIIIYDINDNESSGSLNPGHSIFVCDVNSDGKPELKNRFRGTIVDPEFAKLVDVGKNDFELIIKNIPKYRRKYVNQKEKIVKAKETIDKYEKIKKEGIALRKFLESNTNILYIYPFDMYNNKANWRVLDFNLPFIDTRENISTLINNMINSMINSMTNPAIILTNVFKRPIAEYMPENIKQLVQHYNISIDFGKIEKTTTNQPRFDKRE